MSREYIIGMACIHSESFSTIMHTWLRNDANWKVWEYFEKSANTAWEKRQGRRYSSKMIIEIMRNDTAIADSDRQFKINDHIQPCLSRLYMLVHPERAGFFEIRGRKAA